MSCPSYGFSRKGLNPKMGCVYCTELSIKVHVQDVIRFICITSCWMIPQSLLAFKLHEWAYDLYKALDVLEKIFKCMHNEFPIMLRHASSTLLLTSLNLMFFQTWPIYSHTISSCSTIIIYVHTEVVFPVISAPSDSLLFCQNCLVPSQLVPTYSCIQHSSCSP